MSDAVDQLAQALRGLINEAVQEEVWRARPTTAARGQPFLDSAGTGDSGDTQGSCPPESNP